MKRKELSRLRSTMTMAKELDETLKTPRTEHPLPPPEDLFLRDPLRYNREVEPLKFSEIRATPDEEGKEDIDSALDLLNYRAGPDKIVNGHDWATWDLVKSTFQTTAEEYKRELKRNPHYAKQWDLLLHGDSPEDKKKISNVSSRARDRAEYLSGRANEVIRGLVKKAK